MITFSRVTQAYDPTTGSVTPTVRTFDGEGIMKRADPAKFKAGTLISSASAMLIFECESYGYKAYSDDFVREGDTTEILGTTWTVAEVNPVAIDGLVILAYILVGK
jgi:hypothetical protein